MPVAEPGRRDPVAVPLAVRRRPPRPALALPGEAAVTVSATVAVVLVGVPLLLVAVLWRAWPLAAVSACAPA